MNLEERTENPFPGLRPFEEQDADLFFGRETQIEELEQKLGEHHFVAVIGASGCGKSSLIRAGLLPRLRPSQGTNPRWKVAILRPGNNPIGELTKALSEPIVLGAREARYKDLIRETIEITLRRGNLGLVELAQIRLPSPTKLLVLVDQFEEIFRYRSNLAGSEAIDESAAFVKLLVEAARHRESQIHILLTMRSDYIGDCTQFRDLPDMINHGLYLVPRLTREQLRQVICEPLERSGKKISNRLINQLLNDMSEYFGQADSTDQLPVLQHALMRTWNFWAETQPLHYWAYRQKELIEHPEWEVWEPIDLEPYIKTGGIHTALSKHANEIYSSLSNSESKRITKVLFQRLTEMKKNGESIRHPETLKSICGVAGVSKTQVEPIVEAFRAPGCTFLTPFLPTEINSETKLDISHESLIRKWDLLGRWAGEEREMAVTYHQLEERALRWEKRKSNLLTGRDLENALEWQKRFKPNATWAKRYGDSYARVDNFLRKSKTQSYIKNLALIIGGLCSVVFLAAWLFTLLRIRSSEMLEHSSSSEIYLSSNQQLEALVEGLKAGQDLKNSSFVDSQTKLRILTVLWKVVYETREQNRLVKVHEDSISTTIFSRSGKSFVSGSRDGKIKVWNRDYSSANTIENGAAISSIAFNPDEETLAVAGDDGTIKLWNVRTKEKIVELPKQKDSVTSVDFSPDGTTLISAAARTITLWDRRGRKIKVFGGQHREQINCAKFSPNGKIIASASDDRTVRIWNIEGKELYLPKLHSALVEDLAFSSDGTRIATVAGDKIQVWTVSGQKPTISLQGTERTIYRVAFSPDGKTIASANENGSIDVWDRFEESVEPLTLQGHSGAVSSVNFSPDGKTIASAGEDQTIIFWSASSEEAVSKYDKSVFRISFSPDGRTLASASADKTVRLWDIDDNSQKILHHDERVRGVSFSPDGKDIASVDDKGVLKLWNRLGHPVNSIQAHSKVIKGVDFSPDGSMIATASEDGAVKLWDRSGKPLRTFQEKDSPAIGIAFSPTDQTIASAHKSGSIKLWDYKGNLKLTINTGEGIHSVRFGSNGKIIVSLNNQVKIWDQLGRSIKTASPIQHNETIQDASFSPDGQMIVSAGKDRSTKIWSLDGKLIQTFYGHHATVFSADFSRDSNRVASAGLDGEVVVWDLGLESLLDKGCNRIRNYLATHRDIDICQN